MAVAPAWSGQIWSPAGPPAVLLNWQHALDPGSCSCFVFSSQAKYENRNFMDI